MLAIASGSHVTSTTRRLFLWPRDYRRHYRIRTLGTADFLATRTPRDAVRRALKTVAGSHPHAAVLETTPTPIAESGRAL